MCAEKEIFTCRRILSLLMFTCFILHQMLRVNLSIALIDMIKINTTNQSKNSEYFTWGEKEKGHIIGAYYWGMTVVSLLGGRMAEIYGARKVIGIAFLTSSIFTIAIPFVAHVHYYALLCTRLGIGLTLGVVSSAVPPLAVGWISQTNMSKFMSHVKSIYLGGALTLPVCGYLIENFGWKSVFYGTGSTSLIWSFFWFYFVYDSPDLHPRISDEEKERIFKKLTISKNQRARCVPWKKILTSAPVWATIVPFVTQILSLNLVFNYLPIYLDAVFHFRAENIGLLCSLSYLASHVTNVGSSYLADNWLKTKKYETITVRRIFYFVSFGGSVAVLVFEMIFGDSPIPAVVGFICWHAFCGCTTPAVNPNIVDFAPSYAGTISGICYTISGVACYMQTVFIGYLTQYDQNFEQWKNVFWPIIILSVVGIALFFMFGSSDVQSFNFVGVKTEVEEINSGKQVSENSNF